MKISLPYLPSGICRDQTVHDVEYYTMEHMHEYAEQAIREFVERQPETAWAYQVGLRMEFTNNSSKAQLAKTMGYKPIPLIIKPELDDADE